MERRDTQLSPYYSFKNFVEKKGFNKNNEFLRTKKDTTLAKSFKSFPLKNLQHHQNILSEISFTFPEN